MATSIHYQLWMGDLEPYMSEAFIMAAFRKMREEPKFVRVIRQRRTGANAGYCFLNFATDRIAWNAMHKLNGKPIPDTKPTVLFRLNVASSSSKNQYNRKCSVWVGDLTSDVDDYQLFRTFSSKYASVKGAKVILDLFGRSKGYGFVQFSNEEDERAALREMNGYYGLGGRPLKIRNAVSRYEQASNNNSYNNDYNGKYAAEYHQYYNNTWQQDYNWQNYYSYGAGSARAAVAYESGAYYQNGMGIGMGMGMGMGMEIGMGVGVAMGHLDMVNSTPQQFNHSFSIESHSKFLPKQDQTYSRADNEINNKRHYDLQQYKNQVCFSDSYILAKDMAIHIKK